MIERIVKEKSAAYNDDSKRTFLSPKMKVQVNILKYKLRILESINITFVSTDGED